MEGAFAELVVVPEKVSVDKLAIPVALTMASDASPSKNNSSTDVVVAAAMPDPSNLKASLPEPPVMVWPDAKRTLFESVSTVSVNAPAKLEASTPDKVEGISEINRSEDPVRLNVFKSLTELPKSTKFSGAPEVKIFKSVIPSIKTATLLAVVPTSLNPNVIDDPAPLITPDA